MVVEKQKQVENNYNPELQDFVNVSNNLLEVLSSNDKYDYNLLKDAIQETYFEFIKNKIDGIKYKGEFYFRNYLKTIIKKKYVNFIFRVGKRNNSEDINKSQINIFSKYHDLLESEDVNLEETLSDYLHLLDENNPEKVLIFKEFSSFLDEDKNKILKKLYEGYDTNEIKNLYNISSNKVTHSAISRQRLKFKSYFNLDVKTVKTNTLSYKRKDVQGSSNKWSKLSDKDVIFIKKLIKLGLPNTLIVEKINHKVNRGTINRIRTNKLWTHIIV